MSWREGYTQIRTHDEKHSDNTFKILLATDIHLGCYEDDHIRGDDSFEAFEEVLLIAKQEQVDFVLLGGDLFHENKPSRPTLERCMSLIRKHCFGDRQLSIHRQLYSDRVNQPLNYEDPDLNISLPIFTIHGNHDDPTGPGCLSVIDLLSVNGLVNYFGKSSQVDEVEVEPLVLQKGTTSLALYGLGAMRNERLYRTFTHDKVIFLRTEEQTFKIFIIHQNRVKHGEKSYIKPEFIPTYMDLVFWGHEHDNQISPSIVPVGDGTLNITQPGSTVATSLSDGEAGEKNVGILYVEGKDFCIEPIVLQSVRPFLTDELGLDDKVGDYDDARINDYISARMDDLLELVKDSFPRNPKLPLLRIRVRISRPYNQNNVRREFLSKYVSQVANPEEVLLFSKQPKKRTKFKSGEESVQTEFVESYITEDRLIDFFRDLAADDDLNIFTTNVLSFALEEFVVKEESKAIKRYISGLIEGAKSFYKYQTESRPDLQTDDILFTDVKRELDSLSSDKLMYAYSDSEEYRSEDDTKALMDLTLRSMSPPPSRSYRSPVTSPFRRGSVRVALQNPRGVSKKRDRPHRDFDDTSDSSLSRTTSTRGRKKRKL
ncbi:hypothetical protein LOD99_3344 [Oopsacas minuta]|uniref:Double-strand break repair protein n=1 Tax=Oopsacas minuta TaxID=111878 RepID=A0AAV7JY51_9METZ|nr:hypothetical protein LOD99_3344 [Oopsacas minuta]